MRDYAERKNPSSIAADSVGATLCGRPETCASVTLDPVRGYADRKNLLPNTADFIGLPQKLCFCGKKEAPANKVKHFRTGNASQKAGCRRRVVARIHQS